MDHKLKLGPILARKLDVTSASSGSFSSRVGARNNVRKLVKTCKPCGMQQHHIIVVRFRTCAVLKPDLLSFHFVELVYTKRPQLATGISATAWIHVFVAA